MDVKNSIDLDSDPRSIIGPQVYDACASRARMVFARSRQRPQGVAQGSCTVDQPFDIGVRILPDGIGLDQQLPAGRRQSEPTAAAVFLVDSDRQQTASLERLEIGGERGPVHRKQRSDAAERRRLWPVERHQQRKLTVGQPEWPQDFVETARKGPRRAMHVQAKTIVTHDMRGGERQLDFLSAAV